MSVAIKLGLKASGGQAVRSYTPSLRMFSAEFAEACLDAPDISQDIPIPNGMKLEAGTVRRQPQLSLSEAFSLRLAVFGFT